MLLFGDRVLNVRYWPNVMYLAFSSIFPRSGKSEIMLYTCLCFLEYTIHNGWSLNICLMSKYVIQEKALKLRAVMEWVKVNLALELFLWFANSLIFICDQDSESVYSGHLHLVSDLLQALFKEAYCLQKQLMELLDMVCMDPLIDENADILNMVIGKWEHFLLHMWHMLTKLYIH